MDEGENRDRTLRYAVHEPIAVHEGLSHRRLGQLGDDPAEYWFALEVGDGINPSPDIGIAPGEVSSVALLPGDPFRVPLVAEFLTDVKTVAHNREHMTMTGMYKGRHITATSTGMGCPSTAIAVEELIRVGVTSFIRVGSSAGLQPGVKPGDLLG